MKSLGILALAAALVIPVPAFAAANTTIVQSIQVTGLTTGMCVQADGSGLLTTVATSCGTNFTNGSAVGGTHIESFNNSSIANNTTHVYTFGATYAVAPTCNVSLKISGNGNIFVSAVSTTTVTIDNASGNTATPNVMCAGF